MSTGFALIQIHAERQRRNPKRMMFLFPDVGTEEIHQTHLIPPRLPVLRILRTLLILLSLRVLQLLQALRILRTLPRPRTLPMMTDTTVDTLVDVATGMITGSHQLSPTWMSSLVHAGTSSCHHLGTKLQEIPLIVMLIRPF